MRLDTLNPCEFAPNCTKPALFIHGVDDNFITMDNTEEIMEAYSGEKDVSFCSGDHNAERPADTLE
jgi:dipeptidyl aminopeptidase/acylaminoacyl peptidase